VNELQRLSYLDAMGVDVHVSRGQLPGAAPTRRLALLRQPVGSPSDPVPPASAPEALAGMASLPSLEEAQPRRPAPVGQPARSRPGPVDVPRFSLAAIVAGDWLWLEDLGGAPLAREQVWLVRSMAHALRVKMSAPGERPAGQVQAQVAQFDWPIHNNQQLDSGIEAAHSAVSGFLGRKFREHGCSAVVLLGHAVTDWVPQEQLPGQVVRTAGTLDMLQRPAIKRDVWLELVKLAQA